MLVLSVTECPPALRGDLSRWLLEIDTGVYVGQVSQRVREELWQRTVAHLKTGRAILVFTARNEQKMDFWVHNADWEPIDFDGMKLMLRPNEARLLQKRTLQQPKAASGFSKAARMQAAKGAIKAKARPNGFPERYVVLDLETTGLDARLHHIMELAAIKVLQGREEAVFESLVRIPGALPQNAVKLTGITDVMLESEGRSLDDVLSGFIAFVEDLPLVGHNIAFDMDFLHRACASCGLPLLPNQRIDTLSMARRFVPDATSYQLTRLMEHLGLAYPSPHRSLPDCRATWTLLRKLIEIRQSTM